MSVFLPPIVLVAMAAAAIGWGSAVLRLIGIRDDLPRPVHAVWSFAVGLGTMGWLLYFPGIAGLFRPDAFIVFIALGIGGLYWARLPRPVPIRSADYFIVALCAVLAVVFAFDLCAAWSPQADGDTTAYHLELPRQFLAAGKVFFTPRAIDGAVPLLLHMTYAIALGLGGETAFTLWVMMTKWAAVAVLYLLARDYLPVRLSLGVAAVFATLPALTYGGLTGQVEPKMALLLTVAVAMASRAARADDVRFAILAGLCTGFLVEIKYTMGLPAVAIAVMLLVYTRGLKLPFLYGVAALFAGWQWFAFNYAASGDPVFPLLYGILPYTDGGIWSDLQNASFRQFAQDESTWPRTLWNAVQYPVLATLMPLKSFESERIGLGPYALIVLPLAVAAAWQKRRTLLRHPLTPTACVIAASYLLWFFLGPSLRVRHFLPLMPMLLALLTVAAARCVPPIKGFLPAVIAAVVLIQLGGTTLFDLKFVKYVTGGQTREDFLRANVTKYALAEWVNEHLAGPGIKVLHPERQLNYFLKPKYLFAHPRFSAEVEVHDRVPSYAAFLKQLRRAGITHILFPSDPGWQTAAPIELTRLTAGLYQQGCAQIVATVTVRGFASRTIKDLGDAESSFTIVSLPDNCPGLE